MATNDPRVRTETYNPQKVFSVYTAVGVATLIQFEEDESLALSPASVLGIGDAEAWDLGVRGNNIVLKPMARHPKTNIVVVTNKRTYSFDLMPASANNPATYILSFNYPNSIAARQDADRERERMVAMARAEERSINTNYIWKGDISAAALAPTAAWDDGRFTRLSYDHAGEQPVFYKVLPDGTEALLNYNVDPTERATIELHEVIRTVRARFNNQVIEIHNKSYARPALNRAGTSEHGTVRTERGAN